MFNIAFLFYAHKYLKYIFRTFGLFNFQSFLKPEPNSYINVIVGFIEECSRAAGTNFVRVNGLVARYVAVSKIDIIIAVTVAKATTGCIDIAAIVFKRGTLYAVAAA